MATDQEIRHTFSVNLKRYMDRAGINQNELAARTGASIGSVSNWLHEINEPRAGMLYKLTEIFDCKPSDLLTDAAARNNKKESPPSEESGPSAEAREIAAMFDRAEPWMQQQVLALLRAAESHRAAQDGDTTES